MTQKTKIIFLHKKIKEIEESLFKLGKILSKLKKYQDHDNIEYKGIRNIGQLFNQSVDKDYLKSIRTNSDFNGYIEYESKEHKGKILSIKEYLDKIRPYLIDIIIDHKTKENGKFIQVIKELIIKLKENGRFN